MGGITINALGKPHLTFNILISRGLLFPKKIVSAARYLGIGFDDPLEMGGRTNVG
ncbi:unnamed protein product [marine sediment metagenome]|uniref:Uncharacterized protein n=1 Tax=marine sediment metagenome TaxID=412755 RepID=X1UZW7_9ZZZZ